MPDTSLTGRVWPEDRGTGTAASNHDWDSAGYIGGLAAKNNTSDYVETGLSFTVDYVTPAFDLGAGLAFIKHTGSVAIQLPSDDADTYSGTWDQGMTFAVDVDAETGIALTDAAVNRVWLALDLSTNDGAYVRVDTEASPNVPTGPYLKLGEIDTSADTATETNRNPDATFETVDAGALDTDDLSHGLNDGKYQAAVDGLIVPVAEGFGVGDAYDPTATTNPVNAAVNDVRAAGGGDVLLPPGTITQDAELPDLNSVTIRGYGRNATFLEFTHTGTAARAANLGETAGEDDHGGLENLRIVGPGEATTTADALHFAGNVRDFSLDNVVIIGWGDSAIRSDAKPFEMDLGHIHIQNCSGAAVVHFADLGPSNTWRQAKILGNGTTDQMVYRHSGGGQMHIQAANISGNIPGDSTLSNCAALINPPAGGTRIDTWNYEPSTSGASVMFDVRERAQNRLENVWHHTGTLDYIYQLDNPAVTHCYLGKPRVGGVLNNTPINVATAPGEKILYEGVSGDVTNGTTTTNIRCLADGTDA